MLRSAISWMVTPVLLSASLGERITRKGNAHQFFAPVSVFPTRDGPLYIAVGSDAQWAALTKIPAFAGLDRAEWASNAGRIAEAERLCRELGERVARLHTAKAQALFREAGVPVSRVNTLADVVADPPWRRDSSAARTPAPVPPWACPRRPSPIPHPPPSRPPSASITERFTA